MLLRRVVAACSVAALALLAAACTPDYNWRQAAPVDSGVEVLLPGRPALMSRPINLDGLEVEMSMQGARAGEQIFTVAWVVLPDATPATRDRALAAMAGGMLRNIDARETERTERDIPLVDATGARVGSHPAHVVVAHGERPASGTGMWAIFVARGDRAWQVVAMGTPLDEEAAAVFLDSFAIRQP